MSQTTYKVSDAIDALSEAFPLWTQDSWDNSGVLVGDVTATLTGVMLAVDQTEQTVDEAIEKGCNLVVSHHPLMFRGIKRLCGETPEQRTIIKAIRGGVTLAAFHTPADKSLEGTSGSIGRLIGLNGMRVLVPESDSLCKIVTYVPPTHTEAVAEAMAKAGAGHIGNYSHCAWKARGEGQYKAEEGANPYLGEVGELHHEAEDRVEAICPRKISGRVFKAITVAHPYEEPAIDITPISNQWDTLGYGVVGNLTNPLNANKFLDLIKDKLGCEAIRHTEARGLISRVAICTGAGAEFVADAARAGADAYITADMKYHQMMDAAADIMVVDVGHYESEKITKNIFKAVLTRKLSNFAPYETSRESNPIKYY